MQGHVGTPVQLCTYEDCKQHFEPIGPAVTVSPPLVDYAPLSQLREGALHCSGSHLEKAWAEIKEETVRLLLKMQASTVSPVTNTTVPSNTTAVTKSREQILIQSSGAMIAVIVIGIIIILAVLLIILKTYNRRTHASRVLGASGGSKPRPKMSQSTVQSNVPLSTMGVNSVSGSVTNSNPASENGFQLTRVELNSAEGNHIEHFSTTSGSTVVTIHDTPSIGNT
ncbi:noncompact myelin-associated protein [Lates japonicus]|uniref:Noncompact myelin-associated protein n=1 Tax=Lates japonicus TaxID=270547 RepID=A0AAD3N6Z7_LATJO|nr:noncompact myelin-associated protein [Lates japonicus]